MKTIIIIMLAVCINTASGQKNSQQSIVKYNKQVQEWRDNYEEKLRADDGWLALAGLFWLKPGNNNIGSAASGDIVLSGKTLPPLVATIVYDGINNVQLQPVAGIPITLNDTLIYTGQRYSLRSDVQLIPDKFSVEGFTAIVLRRGDTVQGWRHALRVWDKNSPERSAFKGCVWYPIQEKYRISAKYVAYPEPKTLTILSVIGDREPSLCPGYVVFTLGGKEHRLIVQGRGKRLFINFRDASNGKTTYPAGRYLYADQPIDGIVVLDFNKSYSPPCAFTPYATCPLPPASNNVSVPIPAGEKYLQNDKVH